MRKLVCTIMILFTCFSGSVVLATTVYPAVGGQWNYGVGITGSYSDYMHGQKIHRPRLVILKLLQVWQELQQTHGPKLD